jgi:hypothetical protein
MLCSSHAVRPADCVGNHELWHQPYESLADGTLDAGPDSLSRLLAIVQLATCTGAHACPALVGDELAVVPLQSWYHHGFLADAPADAVPEDAPDGFELKHMDFACKWPSRLAHRSTSGALAPYMAALNHEVLDQVAAHAAGRALISFSHFLPRPELHRGMPWSALGEVEGSKLLGAQVDALAPAVHVFGHTHWAIDVRIGETRYVQYPLGYAHERQRAAYRIRASQHEPFGLVWETDTGATAGEQMCRVA